MSHIGNYDPQFLRLLSFGPFVRRARGWRFGTRVISEAIVLRLIASGRAAVDGDLLRLVEPTMTTRRQHLERAMLLVAQATQEIARSPDCDAIQGQEREQLVGQLEAIVRRLRDVLGAETGR